MNGEVRKYEMSIKQLQPLKSLAEKRQIGISVKIQVISFDDF